MQYHLAEKFYNKGENFLVELLLIDQVKKYIFIIAIHSLTITTDISYQAFYCS